MSHAVFSHLPVLQAEVMAQMKIRANGLYVDGTYGRGGHARSILDQLQSDNGGRLLLFDKDPEAIAAAHQYMGHDYRVTILHDDYAHISTRLAALQLNEQVDGLLLDLGVSSPQLDDARRGFSFQKKGPLDMRMNPEQGESAAEWLGYADEKDIAKVLWELGEERFSRRIARKIVETRKQTPIKETTVLAALIASCLPWHDQKKHPATRSFQAIRMHINHELAHIVAVLNSIFSILKIGGRLLVISFHSLEDRIVKRFFKQQSCRPIVPKRIPIRETELVSNIRLKIIGKAIKASAKEQALNPRARSAVLRVAERIA